MSTWYFQNDLSSASVAVTNVRAFLTTLNPRIVNLLTANIESDQSILDDATGRLLRIETAAPGTGFTGALVDQPLPPATQGVMRLVTDGIVAGKRVRGRFFVPGPAEQDSTGTPVASYQTVLTNAITNLITATATAGNWCVWSRPFPGSGTTEARPGSSHKITGGNAWTKWGVQRRRRD